MFNPKENPLGSKDIGNIKSLYKKAKESMEKKRIVSKHAKINVQTYSLSKTFKIIIKKNARNYFCRLRLPKKKIVERMNLEIKLEEANKI